MAQPTASPDEGLRHVALLQRPALTCLLPPPRKHDFVTAEPLSTELKRVLTLKFGMKAAAVAGVIRFLRSFPVEPMPSNARRG